MFVYKQPGDVGEAHHSHPTAGVVQEIPGGARELGDRNEEYSPVPPQNKVQRSQKSLNYGNRIIYMLYIHWVFNACEKLLILQLN